MEKDSVSPPSSPFHGYTEEEIKSVTISGGLAKPTVFVYDGVEFVEYVLLGDEEAKEKEELYQHQEWSGVEE